MSLETVTFVTPHQGRASGGVHVIEQFASRMAATAQVSLLVLRGPTRPVPGVRVIGLKRSLRRWTPPGDVLVIPGDSDRTADLLRLPSHVGRPVLLVQSMHHPNGELTRRNLELVRDRVAVSSWLAEQVAGDGVRVALVRPGVDRRVFFPPRDRRPRGHRVAMLHHRADWKGGADGAAAMREVRREVPGAELHLFGGDSRPVAGAVAHGRLRPREVAALLRHCAVFVCASWEEGLGLPGLEALLCGTALATTDTGGGRDYAEHRRTALVSSPRDPAALARHVVELLRDARLRRRLTAAGTALAAARYPSWSVATYRLRSALAEL